MTDEEESLIIRVELRDAPDIDELIVAFRRDDELEELASIRPPAIAELRKLGDTPGPDE